MIFSKIIYNNTVYYDLYAEQCLNNMNEDRVVYALSVNKTSLDEICDDIQSEKRCNVFVLECENVESFQLNTLEKRMGELFKDGKTIVFANAKEGLLASMAICSVFEAENSKYKHNGSYNWFVLKQGVDCNSLYSTAHTFLNLFTAKLKKYSSGLEEGNREHTSSSVELTSYIDIKKLMIQERAFMLYAIYRLAMKVKAHWLKGEKKPFLVCQSLNGSYIASVLSVLLDLDLYVLDQVGPINKLYRSLGAKVKANEDYIVISDMVCLGTEVKSVKNIIEYLGGNYVGNATIVRTKCVRIFDNTEEVFVIDENNCQELNYKIITAI